MCFNRISPEHISCINDKVRYDFIIIKLHRLIRKNGELLDEIMSIDTELYPTWYDGIPEQRYKNIMEILMGWYNKIPKTSPDFECVYNWPKEEQKLWFLGAENMEKDVVLWENLLQSIKENDE